MNGAGLDWLTGLTSEVNLPPPPVSFGGTGAPSTTPSPGHSSTTAARSGAPSEPVAATTAADADADDHTIPLSLTADQLTKDEVKTYLRWYNDILVRKGTKLIGLRDIFNFLNNFHLSAEVKQRLEAIFRGCVSLNVGEFFAILRVISNTLNLGTVPSRRLIMKPSAIPKPKSILARKRAHEHSAEIPADSTSAPPNNDSSLSVSSAASAGSDKIDLDSFTHLLLTGARPDSEASNYRHHDYSIKKQSPTKKKKNLKRVKFSDQVTVEPEILPVQSPPEPVKLDLSLPMDQLLNRMSTKPQQPPQQQEEQEKEEEVLKEMEDSFSYFRNIKNVDSALIHGVPSNIPSIFFDELHNSPSPDLPQQQQQQQQPQMLLSPAPTGGSPQIMLSPSNTGSQPHQLLSPSNTGLLSPSLTGLPHNQPQFANNIAAPTPNEPQPLMPAMTGSLSSSMRDNLGIPAPPQPPHRRNRSASSPIPYNMDPNGSTPRVSSPLSGARVPPPPPPSRSRKPQPPPMRPTASMSSFPMSPALPPKIPLSASDHNSTITTPAYNNNNTTPGYNNTTTTPGYNTAGTYNQAVRDFGNNPTFGSTPNLNYNTANILGDLRALQSEVDRIQHSSSQQ